MFSEISLAYWIMDDGYFDSYGRAQTVLLCTESFTKEECIILQSLLAGGASMAGGAATAGS